MGSIVLRHGHIDACCTRGIRLLDDSKLYRDLTLEEIQKKRTELFEEMNKDCKQCKNCGFLCETNEKNIDIGKLEYIIYHPHTTCNLRCCYCPFVKDGSVFSKFDKEKYNPYEEIKNFHKIGLFKENVSFEFGGGEPLLLPHLPESLEFFYENYPKATVVFVSNFSLSNQVDEIISILKNRKIKSVLKTSIDCGTCETYQKIRGQNLFEKVRENLIKACKENAFDEIILKYIFLDDESNVNKKDIDGFIKLVQEVKKYNKNKTTIILDADFTPLYENGFTKNDISKNIIKTASKIFSTCVCDMKCSVLWHGERISTGMPKGKIYIAKIIIYAKCMYIIKSLLKIFHR